MWHEVRHVAKQYSLPEREFVQYALNNNSIYGVITGYTRIPKVDSYNAEDLVRSFLKAHPELCQKKNEY